MDLAPLEIRILNSILFSIPVNSEFRISDVVFQRYPDAKTEMHLFLNDEEVPTIQELNQVSRNIHREMLRNEYITFVRQTMFSREMHDNTPYVVLTPVGKQLKEIGNYELYMQKITSQAHRLEVLETKADQMARRQYNVNVWMAVATSVGAVCAFVAAFYQYKEIVCSEEYSYWLVFLTGLILGGLLLYTLRLLTQISGKSNKET